MAKTPAAAKELLLKIWKPAVAKVKREVTDMQKIADEENKGIKIEPWDYYYYAEKDRVRKYGIDENVIKEYLRSTAYAKVSSRWPINFTASHSRLSKPPNTTPK